MVQMTRFGFTPIKDLSTEEKFSLVCALLIFISPFLPWFVTTGFIGEEYSLWVPGIASGAGNLTMIFGIITIPLIAIRRPMVQGTNNLTIALLLSVLTLLITSYVAGTTYNSISLGSMTIEQSPGAGVLLSIVSSLVLTILLIHMRRTQRPLPISQTPTNSPSSPQVDQADIPRMGTAGTSTDPEKDGIVTDKEEGIDIPPQEPPILEKKEEVIEERVGPSESKAEVSSIPADEEKASDSHLEEAPSRHRILNWLDRVNPDKKVFEKCPSCNKYLFFEASKNGNIVKFKCPGCGKEYELEL